jgi:hypothetical protein
MATLLTARSSCHEHRRDLQVSSSKVLSVNTWMRQFCLKANT